MALSGVDFEGFVNRLITIPAGQSSALISVPIHPDVFVEYDETFSVHIRDVRIQNLFAILPYR